MRPSVTFERDIPARSSAANVLRAPSTSSSRESRTPPWPRNAARVSRGIVFTVLGHVRSDPDLITPKLADLHFYVGVTASGGQS